MTVLLLTTLCIILVMRHMTYNNVAAHSKHQKFMNMSLPLVFTVIISLYR